MKLFHLPSYLLVLLLPMFYLCGATEYYVRPTEPSNTSCPGQPCLTFSQYISDPDYYFTSNTVFRFQSGIHQVNAPINIRNVHNISLMAIEKGTKVIANIPCNLPAAATSDCWGFVFCNTNDTTINGLNILIKSQSEVVLYGMMFVNVTGLFIQYSNVITVSSVLSYSINVFGGEYIDITSSSVANGGILLSDTQNVSITTVTALSCNHSIKLFFTTNTTVNDVTIRSAYRGIYMFFTTYTRISNTTLEDITDIPVYAEIANITTISNIDIHSVGNTAIGIHQSTHLNMTNITILSSKKGIWLYSTYYATIRNTTIQNSRRSGISIISSKHIVIKHTRIFGPEIFRELDITGITMRFTINVHIFNINMIHSNFGVVVGECKQVTIENMTPVEWSRYIIFIVRATNITMQNIVVRSDDAYSVQRREMGIMIANSSNITISHSVFRYFNTPFFTTSYASQPAVVQLHNSKNLAVKNCLFHGNDLTALKLVTSHITVFGHLTFADNRAYRGAAMTFIDESSITLSETGYVTCTNNRADDAGGAIYIVTRNSYFLSPYHFSFIPIAYTKCFLNVEGDSGQKRLTFTNNSAGQGGEVLYGGSLASSYISTGADCFFNFVDYSDIKPYTPSAISSDPSRVFTCNETDLFSSQALTAFYPTTYSIYPGQTIQVSVVVAGQNSGTVAGSVFAQFLSSKYTPQLEDGQYIQSVKQHPCNILHYTILSKLEAIHLVLTLTAVKRNVTEMEYMSGNFESLIEKYYNGELYYREDVLEFPLFIKIILHPCPPGFELHNSLQCECKRQLQVLPNVICNIRNLTIQRQGLVWVGPLTDNDTLVGVVSAQYCPLNYCNEEIIHVSLNQSESQCNYNHSGTLCGGCQPGLSLALGSVQCLQCSNMYVVLLLPLTLAGLALVFFIKALDLTISHGLINGLIFYANIFKPNEHIFLPQMSTSPLTLFIAWLNLDLGIETCFVDGLTAYWKTWLQFVFPFYIWAIAGLIIISARYSTRLARVMGNNSVPVLATLFLLSYAKLLRTIITILSYTVVETPHGQKTVWSADGNIDYLGPQHAPLFVAAIATLLFLWLPYTLLLLLGQWLRKIKHWYVTHALMKVKPFLDAHYGPLKDKHHYWFGVLLCVRVIILLISAVVPANNFSVFTLSISITAGALISFTSVGPAVYCNAATSTFEISLFVNLGLLGQAKFYTNAAGGDQAAATYTLIGVAFIQFLGLVFYQIYSLLKPLFSHCHTHHDDDNEAAEGIWRYNTSLKIWSVPCRATSYHDAATAL